MLVDLDLVQYYLTAVNNEKLYEFLIISTIAYRGANVNILSCKSIY